jgi:hypothetical protein
MRRALAVILSAILGLSTGCLNQSQKAIEPAAMVAGHASSTPKESIPQTIKPSSYIASADPAQERKVIRNAELTLELKSPDEGKRRIESIAEAYHGFVVSSEVVSQEEGTSRASVTVVLRIPADKFANALEDIRRLGYKISREKITGQDVTEEFVDLEARLKAKRAVETQFLEIMKQARQVSDALEVQKALGEVRSEIEQIEGRRRFLENQVSLSTFTITLQTPAPLMSATGTSFFQGVKQAFGEGFDAALEIILWLIRFVLVLIPIVIFVVLPVVLLWRRFHRRGGPKARPQPEA